MPTFVPTNWWAAARTLDDVALDRAITTTRVAACLWAEHGVGHAAGLLQRLTAYTELHRARRRLRVLEAERARRRRS